MNFKFGVAVCLLVVLCGIAGAVMFNTYGTMEGTIIVEEYVPDFLHIKKWCCGESIPIDPEATVTYTCYNLNAMCGEELFEPGVLDSVLLNSDNLHPYYCIRMSTIVNPFDHTFIATINSDSVEHCSEQFVHVIRYDHLEYYTYDGSVSSFYIHPGKTYVWTLTPMHDGLTRSVYEVHTTVTLLNT